MSLWYSLYTNKRFPLLTGQSHLDADQYTICSPFLVDSFLLVLIMGKKSGESCLREKFFLHLK